MSQNAAVGPYKNILLNKCNNNNNNYYTSYFFVDILCDIKSSILDKNNAMAIYIAMAWHLGNHASRNKQ